VSKFWFRGRYFLKRVSSRFFFFFFFVEARANRYNINNNNNIVRVIATFSLESMVVYSVYLLVPFL